MGSIAGGAGRSLAFARSVRQAEDVLAELGYDGIEFEARGREVVATSYRIVSDRKRLVASAIGKNEVVAAQNLVRVLRRR